MRKYFFLLFVLLFTSILLAMNINLSLAAPVTGNATGTVTLTEYYDYECPHCRRMEQVIEKLQAKYPELKVIHRVTPLITPISREIASFTLASQNQGQWLSLHLIMMHLSARPTLQEAESIADQLGLNVPLLFKTMQQMHIQSEITHNIKQAETYAINGNIYLPIFVFKLSGQKKQTITFTGEQPYVLLSAIVKQLESYTRNNVKNYIRNKAHAQKV